MARHTIKKANGGEKADKRVHRKTEPSCQIEGTNKQKFFVRNQIPEKISMIQKKLWEPLLT